MVRGLALVAVVTSPVVPDGPALGQPLTLDDLPRPSVPVVNAHRMDLIVEPATHAVEIPPAGETRRANSPRWTRVDPDGLCRYRNRNRALPAAGRAA